MQIKEVIKNFLLFILFIFVISIKNIKSEYSLYYPKDSQIISVNYTSDNQLLLRYQIDGENKLIIIDLLKEKILTKINFNKSKEWKIE